MELACNTSFLLEIANILYMVQNPLYFRLHVINNEGNNPIINDTVQDLIGDLFSTGIRKSRYLSPCNSQSWASCSSWGLHTTCHAPNSSQAQWSRPARKDCCGTAKLVHLSWFQSLHWYLFWHLQLFEDSRGLWTNCLWIWCQHGATECALCRGYVFS